MDATTHASRLTLPMNVAANHILVFCNRFPWFFRFLFFHVLGVSFSLFHSLSIFMMYMKGCNGAGVWVCNTMIDWQNTAVIE